MKNSTLNERLNNYIKVYSKEKFENELGEKDYNYIFLKNVWAEITPINGTEKSLQANSIFAEISHKITIRANSIQNLSNDMYFIFKKQRYDIMYFIPNYKLKDRIEIFCRLGVNK